MMKKIDRKAFEEDRKAFGSVKLRFKLRLQNDTADPDLIKIKLKNLEANRLLSAEASAVPSLAVGIDVELRKVLTFHVMNPVLPV